MSCEKTLGIVVRASNNLFDICPLSDCASCLQEGKMLSCRIKGKRLDITEQCHPVLVSGDHVSYNKNSENTGTITQREPRRSFLQRWNIRARKAQILAANIDMLVFIFSAAQPLSSFLMLDSACAAAALEGLDVTIVLNKCDLEVSADCYGKISYYESLGYHVHHMSALRNEGIETFRQTIAGNIAVFAGSSGTGKSTLLNTLCPQAQRETATISKKYNTGKHTTSQSVLFAINHNTWIIDTPGINTFDLFCYEKSEIRDGFSDFLRYADKCSYSSCLHMHEPGCAVLSQVEQEEIPLWRYNNYQRILESWDSHKSGMNKGL